MRLCELLEYWRGEDPICRSSTNGFHIKADEDGILSEYDSENNYVGEYLLSVEDIKANDWDYYIMVTNYMWEKAIDITIKAANPEAYSELTDLDKNKYAELDWFIKKWEDYKGE